MVEVFSVCWAIEAFLVDLGSWIVNIGSSLRAARKNSSWLLSYWNADADKLTTTPPKTFYTVCFKIRCINLKSVANPNWFICETTKICLCSGFFGCSGKVAQSDPAATPENPGCRGLLGNTKCCPSWLDWTQKRQSLLTAPPPESFHSILDKERITGDVSVPGC